MKFLAKSLINRLLLFLIAITSSTFKPRRVNPTCRSGRFRSDPHRISSESDIFHKKPIGSDRVFVGFLSVGFRRNPGRIWSDFNRVPLNSDKIRVGIRQKLCRIPSKLFRSDGIRSPLSHMGIFSI